MRPPARAFAHVLIAVLAVSCEGSNARPIAADAQTSDASTDAGPPRTGSAIALADLPLAVGLVVCERRFACCTPAEQKAAGFAADVGTCALRLQNGLGLLTPEMEKSVAAGRADYDGAAFAACLASYRLLTCDQARAGVPHAISLAGCPYLVAKVPLGQACGQSFECQAGYCAGVKIDQDGVCAAKLALGADCVSPDQCSSENCDDGREVCAPTKDVPLCEPVN